MKLVEVTSDTRQMQKNALDVQTKLIERGWDYIRSYPGSTYVFKKSDDRDSYKLNVRISGPIFVDMTLQSTKIHAVTDLDELLSWIEEHETA